MIKPILKWPGGKRQLMEKIRELLPSDYEERLHIEPFVGGGAVFLGLQPESALISDFNEKLMTVYYSLACQHEALIHKLHMYGHNSTVFVDENGKRTYNFNPIQMDERVGAENKDEFTFYMIRKQFNEWTHFTEEERYKKVSGTHIHASDYADYATSVAAMFIYLNKRCFNGLYRENRHGMMNSPYGHPKHPWDPTPLEEDIRDVHEYMSRHVSFDKGGDYKHLSYLLDKSLCGNDEAAIFLHDQKQFWYLDPPYAPLDGRQNFNTYVENMDWDYQEQINLRDFCLKIDKAGHKFMLSNSDCTLIRDLYKDFNVTTVPARRNISQKAETRVPVNEVIVTNYTEYMNER